MPRQLKVSYLYRREKQRRKNKNRKVISVKPANYSILEDYCAEFGIGSRLRNLKGVIGVGAMGMIPGVAATKNITKDIIQGSKVARRYNRRFKDRSSGLKRMVGTLRAQRRGLGLAATGGMRIGSAGAEIIDRAIRKGRKTKGNLFQKAAAGGKAGLKTAGKESGTIAEQIIGSAPVNAYRKASPGLREAARDIAGITRGRTRQAAKLLGTDVKDLLSSRGRRRVRARLSEASGQRFKKPIYVTG